MNSNNAMGFATLGGVMIAVPRFFPALVAPVTPGTDSVRAIWLLFMGSVLLAIGGLWFGRLAWLARGRVVDLLPVLRPAGERGAESARPAVRTGVRLQA